MFLKIDHFKLTSILEPILEPIWLHFRPQNPPKSAPSWLPRAIPKMTVFFDHFFIVLSSFFGPKLGPCWAQVGTKIGSPANPEPTLGRPCPFLTPSRWLWDLQSSLLVSQTFHKGGHISQNGPQTTPKSAKIRTPGLLPGPLAPGPPSPQSQPRPGGMGRSLFE